jgi:hypothetical protein
MVRFEAAEHPTLNAPGEGEKRAGEAKTLLARRLISKA